ncbi:hypothetical protein PAEPH01_1163 [Pancytospora epiphaga]|nr:hypothetical protein PAEPH01_1163 [Pancytospora epiphaga]
MCLVSLKMNHIITKGCLDINKNFYPQTLMATGRETINKDQPSDSPIEACQTKVLKTVGKRKISPEVVQTVKQCKVVEDSVVSPEKCHFCEKKLKFINTYMCRCERFFCSRHRFFDQHNCTFDFQAGARNKLKEKNPKVVAKKIGE